MKTIFSVLVTILAVISLNGQPQAINIATYNIRYDNAGDGVNAWPNRKEAVKALIRYHDFDVFGIQEGLINQVKDIAMLGEFNYYGKGRDDGKEAGEHSVIFYKKERFKLLDSGDFWLSETPEKPGKGWDATCCNRICSWVKLRELDSKKEFFFFNVHFDHQGVVARKESGKLMVKKIKEIAGSTPVVCTGDFNSTPETEQIHEMETLLKDSYKQSILPPYGPIGTFNGFKFDAPMENRIDYIFVSNGVQVLKYATLTDSRNQRYPSDHQPVVIRAVIK